MSGSVLVLGAYGAVAFVAAVILTPICRLVATRLGLVATPKADRWHSEPTALLGGLAIVIPALVVGAIAVRPFGGIGQLLICAALIAAVGVGDDVFSLKPSTKLIAQVVVASLLLFWDYRLGWTESMIFDAMLTLFWIVGITNAFNLLDNMDGLCAGTAIIAGVFILLSLGDAADGVAVTGVSIYLSVLIGATGGFLVYNFHPASIFMGDSGSLFLGLNLAALPLLVQAESRGRSGLFSVVLGPVLLLAIPILDTTLVTAARVLSGRRPSQGGRDHTSHRLVAIGLSQRAAVGILWGLAAAGGGVAIVFGSQDTGWGLITCAGFVLAMVIFAVYLARVRVYGEDDFARVRDRPFTPLVVNMMYKRRVAEVLLDLCLIPLAYYTAYRLRFEGGLLLVNYAYFIQSLPVVLACQLVALFAVGAYRGTWRLFGMMDAVVFAKGVVFGTVASQIVILYFARYEHYSRSVFVIYASVLMLLFAGTRASFRLIGEFVQRRRSGGQRCVIYGTNGASLATIREAFGIEPPRILGFVDDDPLQSRMRVGGYPVLGNSDELIRLVRGGEVDCVVLNTHLLDAGRLRAVEAACRDQDVELLRLHIHLKPLSQASSA